jgi:hypothetical protein
MDVLRQVFSVLLVFSLLGAVLWGLRRGGKISFRAVFARRGTQGHTKSMVALERLALTPQHTLHRLQVNGREVLIATHPQGCTVVTQPTAAERAIGAEA